MPWGDSLSLGHPVIYNSILVTHAPMSSQSRGMDASGKSSRVLWTSFVRACWEASLLEFVHVDWLEGLQPASHSLLCGCSPYQQWGHSFSRLHYQSSTASAQLQDCVCVESNFDRSVQSCETPCLLSISWLPSGIRGKDIACAAPSLPHTTVTQLDPNKHINPCGDLPVSAFRAFIQFWLSCFTPSRFKAASSSMALKLHCTAWVVQCPLSTSHVSSVLCESSIRASNVKEHLSLDSVVLSALICSKSAEASSWFSRTIALSIKPCSGQST